MVENSDLRRVAMKVGRKDHSSVGQKVMQSATAMEKW
jgi:hypothetical protein